MNTGLVTGAAPGVGFETGTLRLGHCVDGGLKASRVRTRS
jgi:hypothetical protein